MKLTYKNILLSILLGSFQIASARGGVSDLRLTFINSTSQTMSVHVNQSHLLRVEPPNNNGEYATGGTAIFKPGAKSDQICFQYHSIGSKEILFLINLDSHPIGLVKFTHYSCGFIGESNSWIVQTGCTTQHCTHQLKVNPGIGGVYTVTVTPPTISVR